MSILDYLIPGWKKNRLKVEAARIEREYRERKERELERKRVRDALAASHAAYLKVQSQPRRSAMVYTHPTKASAHLVEDAPRRSQVSDSSDDLLQAAVAISAFASEPSSSSSCSASSYTPSESYSSSSCSSSSYSSSDSYSSGSGGDFGGGGGSSDW